MSYKCKIHDQDKWNCFSDNDGYEYHIQKPNFGKSAGKSWDIFKQAGEESGQTLDESVIGCMKSFAEQESDIAVYRHKISTANDYIKLKVNFKGAAKDVLTALENLVEAVEYVSQRHSLDFFDLDEAKAAINKYNKITNEQ